MPTEILLTAKLQIPPLRADHVPRPRLTARLEQGLTRKLTLVSSQAGFGKTTILREWLQEKKRSAAWVSLDESDNDHGRFISYMMAALRALDIGLEERIQAVLLAQEQGISIESPMAALLNEFASVPAAHRPVILALDDYHLIRNPQIHESMLYALDYMPEGVHIVIATRSDPPLMLARLRARNQLNELRAPDLRFTRAEAEVFLNKVGGLELSAEQVAALDDRTEGWAAGLQLAAQAMSGLDDVETFVRAFTGSHRYILDYLVDEVFSRQSEETRLFLQKTSILERMTPSLCDAVTGQGNGRAMLERLERDNLFVTPLDNQGQWYRYHHLFADLLKNRADQFSLKEISSLHRKAALWFDSHRQPSEAIGHALQARDYNLAIGMMVKATPTLAMRSEIGKLLKWLESLPAELRASNPRIPLMYAWARFFMTDIDLVEPHVQDALLALGMENLDSENWPETIPPQDWEMLAQVNALRTFVAVNRGAPERAIQIANHALSRLPKEEKLGRFAALAALGDAYRDADNFASASQAYSEGLALAQMIDQHPASLTMRMDLARLRVKMGQLRRAESDCRETLAAGSDPYHPLFPVAQAYAMLGEILRERDELDAAEQTISAGLLQCGTAGYQRYVAYGHVSAARLKFAQGDLAGMERSLDAAEETAAISGSETLRSWARQFRVRLLKKDTATWLANCKLTLDDAGAFQREDEYLTLTRLHLDLARRQLRPREPDLLAASRLMERLLASAEASARTGSAIEILMLQALALRLLGRADESLQKLRQSLELAEPEGYARLFADEGAPMAELLLQAIQRNIHPEYASRLLKLIERREKLFASSASLSEPLTERESEVLRLLAAGLSNQEIAERLVISLSTIKTHVTRIYGKLDVTSRTQAILRARELRII
jgi:LuxR family maltose regulon positive regulatory protein